MARILYVGANASPDADASAWESLLEGDGHTWTYVDDGAAEWGGGVQGDFDLVFIATTDTASLGTKYQATSLPVILMHRHPWQVAGWGLCTDSGSFSEDDVYILDGTHPLANGLAQGAAHIVYNSAQSVWFSENSSQAASAALVAAHGSNTSVHTILEIEAGELLADGTTTAPGPRIGFGYSAAAAFNATGQALALNAVDRALALAGGGVPTPPTLSSATASATGATTGSGSVDTDEGNGTLYWVVTQSPTAPSAAQVQAGQDHTGAAAVDSGSQAVSGTGVQNITGGFSGLTAGAQYWAHYQHRDAAANDSAVASSASFRAYYSLALDAGALALAGPDLNLLHSRRLQLDAGALTLAGPDLGMNRVSAFQLDTGAVPLGGPDLPMITSRRVQMDAGALPLASLDVGMVRSRALELDTGALPLAGGSVTWVLIIEFTTGALLLGGDDINFTVVADKLLSLGTGSLALSGSNIELLANRLAVLNAGALPIAGSNVGLNMSRVFPLNVGTVELDGHTVPLNTSRLLSLETGGLALAGQSISFTLISAEQLILGTGSLPLGGGALNFIASRSFTLDTGILGLEGFNIAFNWSGEPPPDYLNILEIEVAIARKLESVLKLARKLELEVKI